MRKQPAYKNFPIEDFIALGKWLPDAEAMFDSLNEQLHNEQSVNKMIYLSRLIATVNKIRASYCLQHKIPQHE